MDAPSSLHSIEIKLLCLPCKCLKAILRVIFNWLQGDDNCIAYMMNIKWFLLIPLAFTSLFSTELVQAQSNEKKSKISRHPLNFKGTKKQGFVLGQASVVFYAEKKNTQLVIERLNPKGLGATAGLQVNDIITGINGKVFSPYLGPPTSTGAPIELLEQMLEAQAAGKTLRLNIQRAGQDKDIDLTFPVLPNFSSTYPKHCERSKKTLQLACDALVAFIQKAPAKKQYTNAFSALALLSTGDPQYTNVSAQYYQRLLTNIDKDGPLKSNWHTSASAIFLAEYMLATGDTAGLKALQKCCDTLANHVSEKGKLGHSGHNIPYNEKGLHITSSHAQLAWALAAQLGCNINEEAKNKSTKSIMANGANFVPYAIAGKGQGQGMARTAAFAIALDINNQHPEAKQAYFDWIDNNFKRSTNCHAVTSMGVIFGFAGTANVSKESIRKNLDYHKWVFGSVLPSDLEAKNGLLYFAKERNIGGDKYLGIDTVANYQIILALNAIQQNLWIHGNRKKQWLNNTTQKN